MVARIAMERQASIRSMAPTVRPFYHQILFRYAMHCLSLWRLLSVILVPATIDFGRLMKEKTVNHLFLKQPCPSIYHRPITNSIEYQ
jgi:hypothetical protein